jgi:hypothetical protein
LFRLLVVGGLQCLHVQFEATCIGDRYPLTSTGLTDVAAFERAGQQAHSRVSLGQRSPARMRKNYVIATHQVGNRWVDQLLSAHLGNR